MTIDTRTPEGRAIEERNAALGLARKWGSRSKEELEWLILATPSGDRRNSLTEANIHIGQALTVLQELPYENLPKEAP